MGIFNKEVGPNLFIQETSEHEFYIASSKTTVRIDNNFIRIAQGGLSDNSTDGIDSEKTVLLNRITAFKIKEPGKSVGYFQLVYPGSDDTKGGTYKAVHDENTIAFLKDEKDSILKLKKVIENKLIG